MALRSGSTAGAVSCLLIALVCFGHAGLIQVKASLAQTLIERSWSQSSYPGEQMPWPWADSWPVAKLDIGGDSFYVLEGAHGTSLAFGPGRISGTSGPGEPGTTVIAGHRDTHFRVLGEVEIHDVIRVESYSVAFEYEVDDIRVVDIRAEPALSYEIKGPPALALVTCYPLDALNPGPLRLVVTSRIKKGPV